MTKTVKTASESVVIPFMNDKPRRVNYKINFRPICLSKPCSKTGLFNGVDMYLQTMSHQFGVNHKHGTELCVFAFKEIGTFDNKHGSAMQVACLVVSNAFN